MRVLGLISTPVVVVCVLVGALVFSAPVLADGCPNEQVRSESDVNPQTKAPFSVQLPECRAYEMVSPALKNGSPLGSNLELNGLSSVGTVARVGLEGSTVLVESKGIWPGEQPGNDDIGDITLSSEGVQYKITRGGSGWVFKPQEPAGLREFRSSLLPSPVDMSTDGVWGGVGLAPSEAEIAGEGSANFYLLEPGGAVTEIGPSKGSAVLSVLPVGASVDLSHVFFRTALSLFEYVGTGHSGEGSGAPSLVGVDNTGALISQCGIEAGGGYEGEGSQLSPSEEFGEAESRSISAGGSSVFFTARPSCGGGAGPAVNEVFASVGEPGPGVERGSAVTVNVAGTSECATVAFDSCNVTEAVKYQGASTDGSKVFFTSEQPLVAGDADSTSNLYECRLPGDSGGALTGVSPVDPCPDLVRVSVPMSGAPKCRALTRSPRMGRTCTSWRRAC